MRVCLGEGVHYELANLQAEMQEHVLVSTHIIDSLT